MKKYIGIVAVFIMFSFLTLGCPTPGSEPEAHFVAVGEGGQIWWSPDGSAGSWRDVSPVEELNPLYCIAYGDEQFAVAGTSINNYVWKSTNGKSWNFISLAESIAAYGMCYGNDRFVGVGLNQIIWSIDPGSEIWNIVSPGHYVLYLVSYGNGRFVTVGDSGLAWWSPDGSTGSWTDSSPGGNSLLAVAYKP